MHHNNCVSLFDFDGTITTKDSLVEFIKFAIGIHRYYFGLFVLSPMLIAYSLKYISNHTAKEKLIIYFFKGWDINKFKKLAILYSEKKIDEIIRPRALKKIKWHQNQNHKVIIVSASMECWLKAWCQKNKIDIVATRLEVRGGKLTGKFSTPNCYGIEKVNRIKAAFDLSQYDYIYAYGNSRGDKELLALADKSFYKPFRN